MEVIQFTGIFKVGSISLLSSSIESTEIAEEGTEGEEDLRPSITGRLKQELCP